MGAAQKILTIMGVIYTIIGGGVLIAMIFSAMIFTSDLLQKSDSLNELLILL